MNARLEELVSLTFRTSPEGILGVSLEEGPSIFEGPSFILEWLKAYATNALLPKLPLVFPPNFPSFAKKVLDETANIPFGSTLSYKEVAENIGHPGAARAIGNALNKNPFPLFIPCHRVIGSKGKLGGFGCGPRLKMALLNFEQSLLT